MCNFKSLGKTKRRMLILKCSSSWPRWQVVRAVCPTPCTAPWSSTAAVSASCKNWIEVVVAKFRLDRYFLLSHMKLKYGAIVLLYYVVSAKLMSYPSIQLLAVSVWIWRDGGEQLTALIWYGEARVKWNHGEEIWNGIWIWTKFGAAIHHENIMLRPGWNRIRFLRNAECSQSA